MKIRAAYSVIVLAIICLLVISAPGLAQSTSATVSGRVFDPNAAVIVEATVTAKDVDKGVETVVQTNEVGIYVFVNLPPGNYQFSVSKRGFNVVVKPGVTLHVADTISMNFTMQVGGVSETITVEGGAPLINTESAAVSTVVDRQFVANIPLNGRSFQSLIALTPGAITAPGASPGLSGEFSVNGQRTEANYFMVDGVAANTGVGSTGGIGFANGMTPSETALGTTQSMVSVDALQEFRIDTSTYSAEYGRTPGAQVSILTRSGTNEWHGTAFDYLRNGVLDANNWFNNRAGLAKTTERQNDFGGTLGGPVHIPGLYNGKDRTFFFFSYEGMRLSVPQAAKTLMVPDMSLRQNAPAAVQPLLNAFPIPNGAEQGNNLALFTAAYSTPSTLDAVSVRIDQSLGERFRIFGRYSGSPSEAVTRAKGNFANVASKSFDAKTLTLGVTSVLSPRFDNEFRFNSTWHDSSQVDSIDNFGGAQPLKLSQAFSANPPPGYELAMFLSWGGRPGLYLYDYTDSQHQLNVTDSFSFVHGAHILKYGVDLRRLSTYEYSAQMVDLYYFYNPTQVLQNLAQSAYAETFGLTPPDAIFWNYSAYVQDAWKVTNRLHLSLGLRWDVNPPPTNGNGIQPYTLDQITNLATAKLAPQGTPLWQTDYKGFAPRLGVAYQLHQSPAHETVVRGGMGLFYDVGSTLGSYGLSGGVGLGATAFFSKVSFPLTVAQNTLPPGSTDSPYNAPVTAFDPHLKLPYTLQWNVAVEQALNANQKLTVSYVGAGGRRLMYSSMQFPDQINNPNFLLGNGLNLVVNGASSDYDALQVQFQRRLSRGLQAVASYTWSHSIDDLSSNNDNVDPPRRGNSDFDVRHNFAAALTYDVPGTYSNPVASAILKQWGFDVRLAGRSALPFSVNSGYVTLSNGTFTYSVPNLVSGVPIYLSDSSAPGGRVVNIAAFATPPTGQSGTAARNFLRGFNLWQTDLAVRREFPLRERLKLQFRFEAFNLFNRPNFGQIDNYLPDGPTLFGRANSTLNNQLGGLNSLYQAGGPRSIQLALKLIF
jgi:hypothetical protein